MLKITSKLSKGDYIMFNSNGLSLADIAAVTDNNNDVFGGNNGWWILIILFALFGWGNNGYGGFGGGAQRDYVLASDFSNIERKIDGVNYGLCDGFYAMNTGMLNGFNNVGTMIMQAQNGLTAGQTALSNQLATCCCENKQQIADLKYTMATMQSEIMANCNANYRSLHDEMVAAQIEAKNTQIAQLTAALDKAELRASQEAQNNYLVAQLKPCPITAYTVPNPYCNCGGYGYGCMNG